VYRRNPSKKVAKYYLGIFRYFALEEGRRFPRLAAQTQAFLTSDENRLEERD